MSQETYEAFVEFTEEDMFGLSHPDFGSYDYQQWLWSFFLEHSRENLVEYIEELKSEAAFRKEREEDERFFYPHIHLGIPDHCIDDFYADNWGQRKEE